MQYIIKTEDGDILHYGTKKHSGRYPYGSGDRPYQHGGGSIKTPEELIKERQESKEKAISSGNASELMKYRDELTSKEIETALNRIEWGEKLQAAYSKQRGQNALDLLNMVNKLDTFNSSARVVLTTASIAYWTYQYLNKTAKLPQPGLVSVGGKKKK